MPKTTETKQISDDNCLEILRDIEIQYQQYVEVSNLYKLPIHRESETIQYHPPSPEHPLTTNVLRVK